MISSVYLNVIDNSLDQTFLRIIARFYSQLAIVNVLMLLSDVELFLLPTRELC